MSQVIFGLGLIFFLAFVFLALFDRTKIPDVLLLILVGVVLGPAVLGWGSPADFGKSGPVMSTIALIVVLLMGGIELDVDSLGKAVRPTLLLTLSCYAVTMLVMAVVGVYWLGLSWLVAMTMGAILGGTSSAVVIPLINGLQLRGYPADHSDDGIGADRRADRSCSPPPSCKRPRRRAVPSSRACSWATSSRRW